MLNIDIETYSELDLKKVGVYKYAENCEIMLSAYAFDDEPVEVIDLSLGVLPLRVIDALLNDKEIKSAWNATFERVILSKYLKYDIKNWDCTQLRAAYKGLSLKLGDTAEILGCDIQKYKTNLVTFFCKPNAKGERHRGADYIDKWEEFKRYNRIDVETERAVKKLLMAVNIEGPLYLKDIEVNDRGVLVDTSLIKEAIRFDQERISDAINEIKALTNIANPNSHVQVKKWLSDQGLTVDSIDKEHVTELLDTNLQPNVRRVLELRAKTSKSSSKKYLAVERATCEDGRVRGLTQMCGATRTGRWAGRVIQVQNLYKNREPLLHEARELVRGGHHPFFIFDDDILSQLIRTVFISQDVLTIVDFSAIEARVLAWMAGERWVMDVFAGDGKIYEATAAKMYGVRIEDVTKELRAKGKVATLALGYQGALGALKKMGAEGTEEELRVIVNDWRKACPQIVNYWDEVNTAAYNVVHFGDSVEVPLYGGSGESMGFSRDDKWFYITLPSGRKLCYFNPQWAVINEEYGITYDGLYEGKWLKGLNTYGGKLVENGCQAIARDCLAETLLKLDHNVVMHIHDEVVIEGDCLDEAVKVMEEGIKWASGLILKAEGFTNKYYRK